VPKLSGGSGRACLVGDGREHAVGESFEPSGVASAFVVGELLVLGRHGQSDRVLYTA
jgi:hypothetical protein